MQKLSFTSSSLILPMLSKFMNTQRTNFPFLLLTCSEAGAARSSSSFSSAAHSWCALGSGRKTVQNRCHLARREVQPPENSRWDTSPEMLQLVSSTWAQETWKYCLHIPASHSMHNPVLASFTSLHSVQCRLPQCCGRTCCEREFNKRCRTQEQNSFFSTLTW